MSKSVADTIHMIRSSDKHRKSTQNTNCLSIIDARNGRSLPHLIAGIEDREEESYKYWDWAEYSKKKLLDIEREKREKAYI